MPLTARQAPVCCTMSHRMTMKPQPELSNRFFVDITRERDFDLRRLTVHRVSQLVSTDGPPKFSVRAHPSHLLFLVLRLLGGQ
jgi:hypothetical protein